MLQLRTNRPFIARLVTFRSHRPSGGKPTAAELRSREREGEGGKKRRLLRGSSHHCCSLARSMQIWVELERLHIPSRRRRRRRRGETPICGATDARGISPDFLEREREASAFKKSQRLPARSLPLPSSPLNGRCSCTKLGVCSNGGVEITDTAIIRNGGEGRKRSERAGWWEGKIQIKVGQSQIKTFRLDGRIST